MHSSFLGLGLIGNLNVVFIYICNIHNENNMKLSYQIMQGVSEGIFHTFEEPSLF